MRIVKVREWRDLKREERHRIIREEREQCYDIKTLSDLKYMIYQLKLYCFDEIGQIIYVFNSIVS